MQKRGCRPTAGGALVFTDIMGVQTRVEAVLDRMDLMENFIFIKDAKA